MSADYGGGWSNWCTCLEARDGEHAAKQVEETGDEAVDEEAPLKGAFVLVEAYGAEYLKDE